MGRINGWQRKKHHSNLDEAEKEIGDSGRVVIGEWWHPEAKTRVKHIYEPEEENPFVVTVTDENLDFKEEGRYATRAEGGTANKDLMRKYP